MFSPCKCQRHVRWEVCLKNAIQLHLMALVLCFASKLPSRLLGSSCLAKKNGQAPIHRKSWEDTRQQDLDYLPWNKWPLLRVFPEIYGNGKHKKNIYTFAFNIVFNDFAEVSELVTGTKGWNTNVNKWLVKWFTVQVSAFIINKYLISAFSS